MTDENPYRFVDVGQEARGAHAHDWNLREYTAPTDEPILSPEEIRRLGKAWHGFLFTTCLDQPAFLLVSLVLGSFFVPPLWRDPREALVAGVFVLLGVFLQALIGVEAFRLKRAMRSRLRVAICIGLLNALPIVNLFLLPFVGYEAISTLRRHGIPTNGWGPRLASLPVRVRRVTG